MAKKAVKKDAATPARSAKRVKATKAPKQETATAPEKSVKPVEAVTAPEKTVKPVEAVTSPEKAAKPAEVKAAKQETVAPAKTAKPVEAKATKQETAAPAKTVKAAKPAETKVEVYLQFGDREVRVDEVAKAAQEDFRVREEQHELETVRLYLKPEDCAAYYVVNGAYNGKVAM